MIKALFTWIGQELQFRYAEMYSKAEVKVIPDAGHDMFWDNPDGTLSVIREFLEG